MVLHPLPIVSRFSFAQSQTCLTLTRFIEKYISIYKIKQIYYQNICHGVSNESSMVLLMDKFDLET